MLPFYNYLSILNTTVNFVIVLKSCNTCLRKNATSSFASLSSLEPPFQNECESGLFCTTCMSAIMKLTKHGAIIPTHTPCLVITNMADMEAVQSFITTHGHTPIGLRLPDSGFYPEISGFF